MSAAAVCAHHTFPYRLQRAHSLPLLSPVSVTLTFSQSTRRFPNNLQCLARKYNLRVASCISSSPRTRFNPATRLFVSGLSFRTTEESLTNAFKNFGELAEVNLVMDNIAKRPRGFAFIRYGTEEEAKNAIEGMHGKFLDGRVIFVEVAKSRAELREGLKQNP